MRGVIYYFIDYIRGQCTLTTLAVQLFSILAVIFLCAPVHECAHALAAKLLGDTTAADRGRLTLNPMAHIDPMGTLCKLVCCFGWAKPVPVNLVRCRKVSMRTADIIVSMAGPASNILMALIFVILSKVLVVAMPASETLYYVWWAFQIIAQINAGLAVFNLFPVPPLDGYSLLAGVLPRKAGIWVEDHQRIMSLAMFVLLMAGVLSVPLGFLSGKLLDFLNFITGFIH